MSECACGDKMTAELTTIVDVIDGVVLVTRDVPSLVCEVCAERRFTRETVRHLSAIARAVEIPGVETATVDYAKMVAYLTETGAIKVEERELVAAASA